MTDLAPATTAKPDDTLELRLRVIEVKPSDHKYFGLHDLLTFELAEAVGDLPAGLRFQVRRPHDGSVDLRSIDRRRRGDDRANPVPPQADASMTRSELVALAEAQGLDVPVMLPLTKHCLTLSL